MNIFQVWLSNVTKIQSVFLNHLLNKFYVDFIQRFAFEISKNYVNLSMIIMFFSLVQLVLWIQNFNILFNCKLVSFTKAPLTKHQSNEYYTNFNLDFFLNEN